MLELQDTHVYYGHVHALRRHRLLRPDRPPPGSGPSTRCPLRLRHPQRGRHHHQADPRSRPDPAHPLRRWLRHPPLIGEVAGDLADDVYYSTHASLDNPDPKAQNFVKAYQAEYGRAPENAFAALGYDMMNLIADAIQRAGSDDPAAIRDALAATQGFQAVTGTINYAPGQRKPTKAVTIIQVQDGVYSFVKEVTP